MQTTEDRVVILERKVATLVLLLILTVTALLATVIVFDNILDKEFSLPSSHQGTK